MSLFEELENLSDTIEGYRDQNLNESETETFCFEPFIELLGFKRTPADMRKQYPADLNDKSSKGKKVDYAINKEGVPIMIVECKPLGDNLDNWTGQLKDYFTAVREAHFGVLTDGCLYRFYTDFDDQNLMDNEPFLEINLLDIQPSLVAELEHFTKSRFNVDKALAAARRLKYSKVIRQFLMGDCTSPTGDFVSNVAHAVGIPIETPEQKQQVAEIIEGVLKEFKGKTGVSPPTDKSWIKKKISGFTFDGKTYEVKFWNEFLVKVCKILSEDDTVEFTNVLQHMAHSFSRNPDVDFCRTANPKLIGSTGISVYTNMDNDQKKELLKELVKLFKRSMPVPHTD